LKNKKCGFEARLYDEDEEVREQKRKEFLPSKEYQKTSRKRWGD